MILVDYITGLGSSALGHRPCVVGLGSSALGHRPWTGSGRTALVTSRAQRIASL
jgi:hypothetical protein